MDEVVRWTYDNKMVLNASKTKKTMFVTGKRLASKFTNLELNIQANGDKVEEVSIQKLLVLYISIEK